MLTEMLVEIGDAGGNVGGDASGNAGVDGGGLLDIDNAGGGSNSVILYQAVSISSVM